LTLSEGVARAATYEVLAKQRAKPHFGNAGAVKNLLDRAKERMSRRNRATDSDPLNMELVEADFFDKVDPTLARHALKKLVNAQPIVHRIEQLEKLIKVQKIRDGDKFDPSKVLKNWRFVGPPGTGKTTVARAFGEVFHQLGILPDTRVVECKAMDLIGQYIGHTAPIVNAKMDEARGGILFIDEAYAFCDVPKFGADAIGALVGNLTDPKFEGKMVVILAGYKNRIDELMEQNSGLRSRFTEQLEFDNWSADSCVELVRARCAAQNVQLGDDLNVQNLSKCFDKLRRLSGWANARDAVTVADKLLNARDLRADDDGRIEGPLIEYDVRVVCAEMLKQRMTGNQDTSLSSWVDDLTAEDYGAPKISRTNTNKNSSGNGNGASSDKNSNGDSNSTSGSAGINPDDSMLLSSLEQAVSELGYSIQRQLEVITVGINSQTLPAELLALVSAKIASSESRVLPMLLAQCPMLLPKLQRAVAELVAEMEARRQADEEIKRATDAAEKKRLADLETARQRERVKMRLCVYCGRQFCNYMPRDFEWDAGTAGPFVSLVGGGGIQL
jgi:SpoVK/Ycf46/Vps4 family AAA+-type ATPase